MKTREKAVTIVEARMCTGITQHFSCRFKDESNMAKITNSKKVDFTGDEMYVFIHVLL